jgi:hypothetical protein
MHIDPYLYINDRLYDFYENQSQTIRKKAPGSGALLAKLECWCCTYLLLLAQRGIHAGRLRRAECLEDYR